MADKTIRIFKLPMEKVLECGNIIENYTEEQAAVNGELVPISPSQLTGKIYDYYEEHDLDGLEIRDAIINIVVPTASGKEAKRVAESYGEFAHSGFDVNGRHYVRLCAGSGQLRNNTITFVWDVMCQYLTEALYCGISPADLGEDFSVSKWNAYVGLSASGMRFLKSAPHVCVVSDYEEVKPHMPIDYIETEISGGRRNKKITKRITRYNYDDAEMDFAPLNSFDGQGLADPEWVRNVAIELGFLCGENGYAPSEYIIRAPWCKGLVVAFDFKAYCREYGVSTIKDVYGDSHNVDDIDILLSASQFKMWKAYRKYGGWQYYQASMRKYNLRWGIVIANKASDDDYRELNYQYIQALNLTDDDIDRLCDRTETLLRNLCSGHIETVYQTISRFSDYDGEDGGYNANTMQQSKSGMSLLQKAVSHNMDLLGDSHIQEMIYREAEAKFKGAKIGKLLCRGGYSFIVSDPVAQIQHIIRSHALDGKRDIEIEGLIPARAIYSAYWNQVYPTPGKIVLMRSPLIDSSEVTVCGLVKTPEMERWYSHIKSGLILSIHDVNTLALQNCDFDGDRCFSSNDPILIKGAQCDPVPILYPSAGAQLKGRITFESMIEADIRGLNSAVGSLSNLATCLYALRDMFEAGSEEYLELSRRIKIVSELVGVEIDKIKTGIPPSKPSAWNRERMTYEQYDICGDNKRAVKVPACSADEQDRIRRHNALIPTEKPLFMRYVYDSMNKNLIKYDKAFDCESRYNYGRRLADLISADQCKLSEEEKRIVDRYHKFLPAIDSPCNMNKICRKFERLQKEMKRHRGSRNMLPDFVTKQDLDEDVLREMAEIVELFQRQKRFIIRSNNMRPDGNKQIAKETKERFDAMHDQIRSKILGITDGDVQAAFNGLVELNKRKLCAESTVWDLLDDMILLVIPCKPMNVEAVA